MRASLGVPRCRGAAVPRCFGTPYTPHGRGWYVHSVPRAYIAWGPGGKLPCASGAYTYSTRDAGTRSPCVQYGGPRDLHVHVHVHVHLNTAGSWKCRSQCRR